jgi:hypothetical protein
VQCRKKKKKKEEKKEDLAIYLDQQKNREAIRSGLMFTTRYYGGLRSCGHVALKMKAK